MMGIFPERRGALPSCVSRRVICLTLSGKRQRLVKYLSLDQNLDLDFIFSPFQFSLFVSAGPHCSIQYAPPQQRGISNKRGGGRVVLYKGLGGARVGMNVKKTPDAKAKWTRPEP